MVFSHCKQRRRGSILIFTIWILTTLVVFAVYIAYMVNQKALIVGRIEDNENLHFIAEAGVKMAMLELKIGKYPPTFSSLGQNCLNNPDAFKDIPVGKGVFAVFYKSREGFSPSGGCRYGFIDEEQKININTAPQEVLSRLMQLAAGTEPGSAEKTACAIADYRDADTVTKEGVDESFVYGVKMKNSSFEILDELKQVPGITPEIFLKIKGYITVYGTGKVNINTAEQEVLEILGLSRELAKKVLLFRAGKDGVEGTSDDNIVDEINNYWEAVSGFENFTPQEKGELEGFLLSGALSTRSSCVFINSEATLKNKKKSIDIECIYDLKGKIRYWKERYAAG